MMAPEGPFGWVALAGDLAGRHRRGHPRLFCSTGHTFMIVCHDAVETQLDGDPKGAQFGLTTRALAGGLVVRVPAG